MSNEIFEGVGCGRCVQLIRNAPDSGADRLIILGDTRIRYRADSSSILALSAPRIGMDMHLKS
jgi:hypothetical protein